MDISITQGKFVNSNQTLNFKGNHVAKMLELVGGDGVFKNCTNIDFQNFKSYCLSMQFKMGVTADDVAKLSKFEGTDFVKESYLYLCKKVGIPDELRPPVVFGEIMGEDFFGYYPMQNMIIADVKKMDDPKLTKNLIFAAVRHELQHTLQYFSLLRHEELGVKAIDSAGEIFANKFKTGIVNLIKHSSVEQVEKYCIDMHDQTTYEAVQLVKKGDAEGLDKFSNEIASEIKAHLAKTRDLVLKYFEPIKKDSPITDRLAGFFEEFHGQGYRRENNTSISMAKYMKASIEDEAMLAQMRAIYEFMQEGCYIKNARDRFNMLAANGEVDSFVERLKADKKVDKAAQAMKKAAKE